MYVYNVYSVGILTAGGGKKIVEKIKKKKKNSRPTPTCIICAQRGCRCIGRKRALLSARDDDN